MVEFDPALRPGLAGGFHYEGDAFLRPDALTANWARCLKRRGVRFEESRRLLRVETAGGKVARLVTDAGEETADHYVFALGAWSTQLAADLDCPIPVEPGKGYSVTTTRPRNCPRHALLFAEHRVAVTPFEDGFRLGSMMEFAGFDATTPPRRIRQLVDSAKHYLHEPVGDRVLETWSGWRPMTWDSLPLIGRVPGLDNALLATGHHMLGMTMAPATGRLVAEIIGEKPPTSTPHRSLPGAFRRGDPNLSRSDARSSRTRSVWFNGTRMRQHSRSRPQGAPGRDKPRPLRLAIRYGMRMVGVEGRVRRG